MSTRPAARVTRAATGSSAALWFGVLGAPLVWIVQLVLDYGLEEAVACAPASQPQGQILGFGIETVIQTINAVAVAVAIAALAVSVRCLLRLRERDESEAGRARFMALAGVFNSGLFLVIIAAKILSPIFLDPCTESL